MNNRVTDSFSSSKYKDRINSQRSALSSLQEQILTGKKINRASDDPLGAEIVLKLKTSQTEIEQFGKSADTVKQKLTTADDALRSYNTVLDRLKSLLAQGLSDNVPQTARNFLAIEVESLKNSIINTANTKDIDEFIFGGTRQTAPPLDPTTGNPNASPTNLRYQQIEPGANPIATGVLAETVFADSTSNIIADLNATVLALRGTGNPTADRATLENSMRRMSVYSELSATAQAKIGTTMNFIEIAKERLDSAFLANGTRISELEDTDFAEAALKLAGTQRSLEATLQIAANGRRNLFDFLG